MLQYRGHSPQHSMFFLTYNKLHRPTSDQFIMTTLKTQILLSIFFIFFCLLHQVYSTTCSIFCLHCQYGQCHSCIRGYYLDDAGQCQQCTKLCCEHQIFFKKDEHLCQFYSHYMEASYTFDVEFLQFLTQDGIKHTIQKISQHLQINSSRIKPKQIEFGETIFDFIIFSQSSQELYEFDSKLQNAEYEFKVKEYQSEKPKKVKHYEEQEDHWEQYNQWDYNFFMEFTYKFDVNLDQFILNGMFDTLQKIKKQLRIPMRRIFVRQITEGPTIFTFIIFSNTINQLIQFNQTLHITNFDYNILQFSSEGPNTTYNFDWEQWIDHQEDDIWRDDDYEFEVKGTIRFNVTLSQFLQEYGQQMFILIVTNSLQLKSPQLQIMNVREGSTIIDFGILGKTSEELTNYMSMMQSSNFHYPVVDFTFSQPTERGGQDETEDKEEDKEDEATDKDEENSNQSSQTKISWLGILIGAISVIIGIFIGIVIWKVCKVRANNKEQTIPSEGSAKQYVSSGNRNSTSNPKENPAEVAQTEFGPSQKISFYPQSSLKDFYFQQTYKVNS